MPPEFIVGAMLRYSGCPLEDPSAEAIIIAESKRYPGGVVVMFCDGCTGEICDLNSEF